MQVHKRRLSVAQPQQTLLIQQERQQHQQQWQQQQQQQAVQGVPVHGVPVPPVHDGTFEINMLERAEYMQYVRRFMNAEIGARDLNRACYISGKCRTCSMRCRNCCSECWRVEQPLGCYLGDNPADRRRAADFLRGYNSRHDAGDEEGQGESPAFDEGREARKREDPEIDEAVNACEEFLRACNPDMSFVTPARLFFDNGQRNVPRRRCCDMKHTVERLIDTG